MSELARIVALGGGHGLSATLTALRGLTPHLTAVVTVADDGGSSGRLRAEMGIVPPGDLRMALSALCSDDEWGRTWRDVLQWRFATDGPLDGHAMGNLLIAALWERTDDVVDGLAWVGRLLRSQGRVLPLSTDPLEVSALVRGTDGVREVRGQVAVATAEGTIEELRLAPSSPRVPAQTIEAIDQADLVVLGPGSWYTSVLTHFAVAPVAAALERAAERCVVVLNVGHEDEETAGTDRVDDVRALRRAAPAFVPGHVLIDVAHGTDAELVDEVSAWGATLRVGRVCSTATADAHEPGALRRELVAIALERDLVVTADATGVAG